MPQQPIPLVDLKRQYFSIKEEVDQAIQEVLNNTAFVGDQGNRFNAKFEEEFTNYLGVDHFIGCGNGTDSIEILLRAFGVGKGDEVLVPAMSWISSSSTITAVGATPVFVDIDPVYYTIDEDQIEKHITPNTKAIIPVHLYGNMANMEAIMAIADKHDLVVIEDCAQAHGAELKGKKAGTWGHASSFSFYPGKNLGAYGDAGGMATNNAEIATMCRTIQNHGQQGKHNHLIEGRNSKLDGIQAAILSVKLKYLDQWTDARIQAAQYYAQHLQTDNLTLPTVRPNSKHVFHLYVVQCNDRDGLMERLKEEQIFAGIHYPVSLPFLPAYAYKGHKLTDFPVSASFHPNILSLPLFPELTEEEVKRIADVVNAFVAEEAATA